MQREMILPTPSPSIPSNEGLNQCRISAPDSDTSASASRSPMRQTSKSLCWVTVAFITPVRALTTHAAAEWRDSTILLLFLGSAGTITTTMPTPAGLAEVPDL